VKKQVPTWPVVAIAVVIVVAVAAYFFLVRPKRTEAGRLGEQIGLLEADVAAAKLAAQPDAPKEKINVADLFELTKAMPDRTDMPGIILELDSIAEAVGIEFVQISPELAVAREGYRILPIRFVFEGNYFGLSDFLFRVRNLVAVRNGRLYASGRFFTLDFLRMVEGPDSFPEIEAELVLSAYVYDAEAQPSGVVPPATGETTTTTTTTATTAEASAAGAP
jgi:Pilus assembly protein, PilO